MTARDFTAERTAKAEADEAARRFEISGSDLERWYLQMEREEIEYDDARGAADDADYDGWINR